jgi:hypothetical protein
MLARVFVEQATPRVRELLREAMEAQPKEIADGG